MIESTDSRIRLLDGAMGTTLESLGYNVDTPLWGCDLLLSSPEVIQDVHARFLDSGVDLVETGTYQLTLDGICQYANLTPEVGAEVMRRGIAIAAKAAQAKIARGDNEVLKNTKSAGVVLSLGPYGAVLSPGQEYGGMYPPPYGPSSSATAATSASSSSSPSSMSSPLVRLMNAFSDSVKDGQESAITALERFHYDRLLVYSEDKELWNHVSWIAFETIPLLYEIKAIRRAMRKIKQLGRGKRFWITSAFPDGLHPQSAHYDVSNEKVTVDQVLEAMIVTGVDGDEDEDVPTADGVGLNCTNPQYIATLQDEFSSAYRQLKAGGKVGQGSKVSFVLYPDGGSVYDPVTKTWSAGKVEAATWASTLVNTARKAEQEKDGGGEDLWGGVIVGGCCKAGFDEISALRTAIDRMNPARPVN